jgi:hypothetical protein
MLELMAFGSGNSRCGKHSVYANPTNNQVCAVEKSMIFSRGEFAAILGIPGP